MTGSILLDIAGGGAAATFVALLINLVRQIGAELRCRRAVSRRRVNDLAGGVLIRRGRYSPYCAPKMPPAHETYVAAKEGAVCVE